MSPMAYLDKARLAAEAALEMKAEEPVVLDMSEVSAFADAFVIVSGRSERHVRSVAEAVIDAAGARPERAGSAFVSVESPSAASSAPTGRQEARPRRTAAATRTRPT